MDNSRMGLNIRLSIDTLIGISEFLYITISHFEPMEQHVLDTNARKQLSYAATDV